MKFKATDLKYLYCISVVILIGVLLSYFQASTAAQQSSWQRWEYLTFTVDVSDIENTAGTDNLNYMGLIENVTESCIDNCYISLYLNQLGQYGWEVYDVVAAGTYFAFFLKRPFIEEANDDLRLFPTSTSIPPTVEVTATASPSPELQPNVMATTLPCDALIVDAQSDLLLIRFREPSEDQSLLIGSVRPNSPVILSEVSNEDGIFWYRVLNPSTNGFFGWIQASYLILSDECLSE